MKQQLTGKTILLFMVGVMSTVILAGVVVTVAVRQIDSSARTATLKDLAQVEPSSVSLCNSSKAVTNLAVTRGTFMNPTTFSFPSVVFVGNTGSARSVVTAICATRPFAGKGIFACPFDQALTYDLVFTLPKYRILPINLGGSGFCSWLKGTGKFGWIRPTSNFFQVLGSAMHLHLATSETFAGKMK